MSITPKVKINLVPTQEQATIQPATLPACIVGPMAQVFDWDDDKVKSFIGVYGKDKTVSIEDKYNWGNLPLSVPCYTGEYAGVDADAVPDPDNCTLVLDEVRVVVGMDKSSNSAIVAGNSVVIDDSVSPSKFITPPIVGDKILLALNQSGTPTEYTITSVSKQGTVYQFYLNAAPSDGSYYWIIERELSDVVTVDNNLVWPSSSNIKEFLIYQGSKVNGLPVIYGKLYNTIVAPKVGTYTIGTVSSVSEIENAVGKVSTYNKLAFALYKALSLTSTTVYYIPVPATYTYNNTTKRWDFSYATGFAQAKDILSSNTEIHKVVPLTLDSSILASFKIQAESEATPDKSVFRRVYGSMDINPYKSIVDKVNDTYSTDTESNTLYNVIEFASGYEQTVTIPDGCPIGGYDRTYMGLGFLCDKVEIIEALNSSGHITAIEGRKYDVYSVYIDSLGKLKAIKFVNPFPVTINTDIRELKIQMYRYDGTKLGIEITIGDGSGTIATIKPTSGTWGNKISKLVFTNFNPINNGVAVGDYLKITLPVPGLEPYQEDLWQNSKKPTLDSILLKITSVGTNFITIDTSSAGVRDLWGDVLGFAANAPSVGIVRLLNESALKNEINAFTNSINSSRVVLFTPGYVDTYINSEKTTVPVYYYAAVTAVLRSVLPVHTPMTRYSIPGYYLSYMFKNYSRQFWEDISNMGAYVLVQDSEMAGLYCFHQLTSTRSGIYYDEELSCMENLDDIARETKKLYNAFIGKYNITSRVLGILKLSVDSLLQSKQASYYPNIGPQIESYTEPIVGKGLGTSDGQFAVKPGFVTVYFTVKLPEVLNNVEVFIYY